MLFEQKKNKKIINHSTVLQQHVWSYYYTFIRDRYTPNRCGAYLQRLSLYTHTHTELTSCLHY